MTKVLDKPDPKELCVPIYLNQKIVFDLLAVQEDGFSQLSTLRTSSNDSETTKNGVGASIGVSNVFALLGVTFSGEHGKEKGLQEQRELSREKVHTPTSLFAKCRTNLIHRNLLHQNLTLEGFNDLKSGDFVEFQAVLHKNPIVDFLTWLKTFVEMILPLTKTAKQGVSAGPHKEPEFVFDKKTLGQIDAILKMVTPADSIELVGDLIDVPNVRAVLSCQPEFFNRSDPTEIIDGDFFVLGKVVKVVQEDAGEINLLRKTPLGRVDSKMLSGLTTSFSRLEESGFQNTDFTTAIKGPSFLIIPIAIFL